MEGQTGTAQGKERENRGRAQAEQCYAFNPFSCGPLYSVQILHLLRNQFAPGVLFQISQKTQWEEAQLGPRSQHKDHRAFLKIRWDSMGKSSGAGAFDFKGKQ
jgi:hypothetical protein